MTQRRNPETLKKLIGRRHIKSTRTFFIVEGAGATRALRRGFLAEKYGLESQYTRREPS